MRDILGTDIELTNFDISVDNGDIKLATGTNCLKQDLLHALLTPLHFWGLEIQAGSRLVEFVNGSADPFYMADLKRAVNEVFSKEPRVQPNGWKVNVYKRTKSIRIEIKFLPIEQATPETMEIIIDRKVN